MAKEGLFRSDVKCSVRKLTYDFEERVGHLFLEDGNCTDMSGCIKLFRAIDPEVVGILTFAGGRKDTGYFLANGKWQSRVAEQTRKKGTV